MNKDFPLNRFDFSNLIEFIQKEKLMPNIITDNETGIEFYDADTVSREVLINVLEDFNLIDNLAQNDSKKEYEKHKQLGVKSYQFEPSWVKITAQRVIVGYIGIHINSDFSLTFSKINNEWTLIV